MVREKTNSAAPWPGSPVSAQVGHGQMVIRRRFGRNSCLSSSAFKYRVADGERIYVIGDIPELGKWDKMHAPRLAQPVSDRVPVESGLWVLDMHIPRDVAHTQFEYKYFTRKSDGSRRWEGGENRCGTPF